MMPLHSILVLGLLLGMRHAAEPDHLAAVASMSAGTRDRMSTVIRGATWGAGHTFSLLLVGALSLMLGLAIPPTRWFERGVGLMLAVLGVSVLLRIARVHVTRHHEHEHQARRSHRFDIKAACVGMM